MRIARLEPLAPFVTLEPIYFINSTQVNLHQMQDSSNMERQSPMVYTIIIIIIIIIII